MKNKALPLQSLSVYQLYNSWQATYEIPIYQRNYAWGMDEISTLLQDVYDAYKQNEESNYYIGTLVTFHKGDHVYEVIDGQQRLTTINLVLNALELPAQNKLTYRARKKSNDTIQKIPDFNIEEKDHGIVRGFKCAEDAIKQIAAEEKNAIDNFKKYFQEKVYIIHYQVPKDIDLNHYFEIMNSRGEQLEKHEIVKARLIEKLNEPSDRSKFSHIWECCCEMNVYVQQKYPYTEIFGDNQDSFKIKSFDDITESGEDSKKTTISALIEIISEHTKEEKKENYDAFQPIIDFPNFLLIVLKITLSIDNKITENFILDDKELISEFDKAIKDKEDKDFVKTFGFNLLKAKYLLDNYIVHHSNEDEKYGSNPWKLQKWHKEGKRNLSSDKEEQERLVHLLSMFEVSFGAKQRKNYLFYCLFYLFLQKIHDTKSYCQFMESLAEQFLNDVYLKKENLNSVNIPEPGIFDKVIMLNGFPEKKEAAHTIGNFPGIYGNGESPSQGIPLFIFNYLDYKLWDKYAVQLRGKGIAERDDERKKFFNDLGCSDFGLDVFDKFYFSRTRRSLEHYYPQANVKSEDNAKINCFGNYAMIGNSINSSGSHWTPYTKTNHYLDNSGKIPRVSVASLKFMIMMQQCKDNHNKVPHGDEWTFTDIKEHQEKMLEILKH